MTRGLDHVSVTVADLERSLRFYQGLLEVPLLGRGEDDGPPITGPTGVSRSRFKYADLDLGAGQILELLQYLQPQVKPLEPTPFAPRGGHIGLRVPDLEASLDRLRAAGVPPRFDPIQLDSPAWWAGARVVYVSDPDGTTVELVERRSPPTPATSPKGASRSGRQRGLHRGRAE
jgi:catechol 2,3-dioxygenase-like lactoylglutathione lyase family enzyme